MINNDILIRLRYALDIKDVDMVKIFELGGVAITKEELQKIMVKSTISDTDSSEKGVWTNEGSPCSNSMLESFLNGLIVLKRGKKESDPGEADKQAFLIKDDKDVNNVVLKKVKIALSLTGEDMLHIFQQGGAQLSNSELSAVLRRQGQRNYKPCGDRYIKVFFKGLTARYRENK